jgi:predicted  nucleic acid-binding Zn-ribbon protein
MEGQTMDERYVIDLLKDTLNEKQEELDRTTKSIDHIRNRIHISTDKKDYIWLKKDLDVLENDRRELRGKVSALSQAIKKLEKE